jgi:homocysteine S-methyltransferase
MSKYRAELPQAADKVFLADGGIETTLIFHDGLELPDFAAFVLLDDEAGKAALRRYFVPYLEVARDAGVGIVLESATWRASPDWAARLGYTEQALDAANRAAIDMLVELRDEYETPETPVVVSGCIGPRGDGYNPSELMTPEEAERYHSTQVATFSDTEADLVTAITMTHTQEAIGLARAAAAHGMPSVLSFTVETDGKLPSGEGLEDAIRAVDEATGSAPAYYMVNCAHPTHFEETLQTGDGWQSRLRGVRANASTMSHAELDEAEELDAGDPADLGARYARLRQDLPQLTVLGGCCGTDSRHIGAIAAACVSA